MEVWRESYRGAGCSERPESPASRDSQDVQAHSAAVAR